MSNFEYDSKVIEKASKIGKKMKDLLVKDGYLKSLAIEIFPDHVTVVYSRYNDSYYTANYEYYFDDRGNIICKNIVDGNKIKGFDSINSRTLSSIVTKMLNELGPMIDVEQQGLSLICYRKQEDGYSVPFSGRLVNGISPRVFVFEEGLVAISFSISY